ncbi:hypothetical protein BGV18_08410 [Clostridioides difficile]|nr:hypothetical protein [Clostridioides difficile]PBH00319.1 hypothetical protein BGV12_16100 [Clostridioides difficile]PBH08279.1 hypothetical protein BGV18_08410 [Clostridioides difficile]
MFIARKVSIKSIINSQSLYIEYGNLFTYLNISKIVVHRKSIGVVLQKYIKKKINTAPRDLYSNPKNDKKPIPITVKIQKVIPKKTAKNKNTEINSPKGILLLLLILINSLIYDMKFI